MPLVSWSACLAASASLLNCATAFTGSEYRLSHEFSGANFFDGWDFYSGRDPTGGFVTYYSRSSAQLTGLIKSTEEGPAYMGVNYIDKLPFNNQTGRGDGAGRPSVRIASKQAFTHGLFIGDFEHIPAGICGTWPAFWTLGPNWPYNGEIDILEGVNQNTKNVMSLHTNETCIIEGGSNVMTGQLENTNCAYYPDYNVGCGVSDTRATSFGVGFNQAGGGVYAMQWTSEYIHIWHWPRSDVPTDVDSKQPDPGSWGLPIAQLAVGNCTVDQHFQSHKIIFDTTFCGEYAGNPYVWKTSDANSCEGTTGLATCDNFVANNPEAFKEAYWGVNYVRVYQLVNPEDELTATTYIASEQPPNAATNTYSAPNAVATPNLDVDALCPQYNFSIVSDGKRQYEIACDFDPPGPDIAGEPYSGFKANSFADCIKGCTYMNENNGTNKCGGVAHFAEINFCYFKKYIDGNLKYRPGYNQIRLIYYGYPQITDDPRSIADSTLTSSFVETIPTPQTYRPSTITNITTTMTTTANLSSATTSRGSTIGAPPMGENSTSITSAVPSDYSETVTSGYANSTTTSMSAPSSVASTNPSVTNTDFYIVFNVDISAQRLMKREIRYVAFDTESQSILVTDQTEAARFQLGMGDILMSGGQYVAVDSDAEPPRILLTDRTPETPARVQVDDDGNLVIEDVAGYCLTADGELAVGTVSRNLPEDCAVVEPELIAAPNNNSSTSTTTTATISMEGLPVVNTTSKIIFPSSSSSSTSGTNAASGSTSISLTRTSTSTLPSATLPTINNFTYVGCFGVPTTAASLPGISVPFTAVSMTNDLCTKHCGQQNAYYAGTFDNQCFCGTSEAFYANLVDYPDGICNKPCPGANRDICGGEVGFQDAVPTARAKRGKLGKRQSALFLISLYNNTLLLGGPGETDVPGTTDTAIETVTDTVTMRPTNTDLPFPTDPISYNVTGTNTATVISTTFVDVCKICPGGMTTTATTITVPHCGCTASYDAGLEKTVSVPSPMVPMLTTTKECACGHNGAQSTITVTLPHTSSIAQLALQVRPVIGALDGKSGDIQASQYPAPNAADAQAGILPGSSGEPMNFSPEDDAGGGAFAVDDIEAPIDIIGWPAPNMIGSSLTPTAGLGSAEDSDDGQTPIDSDNTNIAAAPASSPMVGVASNTAILIGVSNYTIQIFPGANSTFTGPDPVASFTSSGSKLLDLSIGRQSALLGCKYVSMLALGLVAVQFVARI